MWCFGRQKHKVDGDAGDEPHRGQKRKLDSDAGDDHRVRKKTHETMRQVLYEKRLEVKADQLDNDVYYKALLELLNKNLAPADRKLLIHAQGVHTDALLYRIKDLLEAVSSSAVVRDLTVSTHFGGESHVQWDRLVLNWMRSVWMSNPHLFNVTLHVQVSLSPADWNTLLSEETCARLPPALQKLQVIAGTAPPPHEQQRLRATLKKHRSKAVYEAVLDRFHGAAVVADLVVACFDEL
jgi:hypothetical protein